jgi:hypothetical protein
MGHYDAKVKEKGNDGKGAKKNREEMETIPRDAGVYG